MKQTLGILGAGALGQQIRHLALTDKHYREVVFFDDYTSDSEVCGSRVIGGSDAVEAAYQAGEFSALLLGVGYKHMKARGQLYERYAQKVPMGTLVHSSCWVDPSAHIGPGAVLYPGCIVDAGARVKENVLLNLGVTLAHDSEIGAHSFISPRVAIAGFTTLGNHCMIGINSTLIDGLQVAAHTQVGGGSVIIKNIETAGLYVGNPARLIKSL